MKYVAKIKPVAPKQVKQPAKSSSMRVQNTKTDDFASKNAAYAKVCGGHAGKGKK
jgi:hypothetical protein